MLTLRVYITFSLSCYQWACNWTNSDFSDPQGGKGSCDSKAATSKSHMRTHLNAGHDIETASQMMTAIESSGGIAGVRVTVSGPQPTGLRWGFTEQI